jgi:hypothetical protein
VEAEIAISYQARNPYIMRARRPYMMRARKVYIIRARKNLYRSRT